MQGAPDESARSSSAGAPDTGGGQFAAQGAVHAVTDDAQVCACNALSPVGCFVQHA